MTATALPGIFKPDRTRHASVQVFEHLRGLIVTLELKPGTVLSRPELTAYFGLSQTPIRDALLRLEAERLVDIFPQHATRVRAIDIDSARQAHLLRLSLELEIVRTLAQAHAPSLMPRLDNLVNQQKLCLKSGDLDGFVQADQAFHRELYVAANMDELWTLMRARSGNLDRLRRLHLPLSGKGTKIIGDHASLADAIRRNDPESAVALVRTHLSGSLSALNALREEYPGFLMPAAS